MTTHASAFAHQRMDDPEAVFSIRLEVKVKDIVALWMEAFHVGLGQAASKLTDVTRVIEVIGPQVDPSVADCLAMLVDSSRFPGCSITHIDLERGQPQLLAA